MGGELCVFMAALSLISSDGNESPFLTSSEMQKFAARF